MDIGAKHFVYVYRDQLGNPVYFGQGELSTRPGSHKAGTHNAAFEEWLAAQDGQFRIEVLGPLGSQELADAVETALISACMPAQNLAPTFFNQHEGNSAYRFRPYGVPNEYAARTLQPVGKDELMGLCARYGPLMFVRIGQQDFDEGDGRKGYDLANPPSDNEIRARVEKWWQVASRCKLWEREPRSSPALLIGVTGGPGAQSIIASATIDRTAWGTAEIWKEGLMKIPLLPSGLDAANLRGRPVDSTAGLRFNSFRHAQFRIWTGEEG